MAILRLVSDVAHVVRATARPDVAVGVPRDDAPVGRARAAVSGGVTKAPPEERVDDT